MQKMTFLRSFARDQDQDRNLFPKTETKTSALTTKTKTSKTGLEAIPGLETSHHCIKIYKLKTTSTTSRFSLNFIFSLHLPNTK